MDQLREQREEQLKDSWFNATESSPAPYDAIVSHNKAFGDIIANLTELSFEDYETLKDELDG